MANGESGKCAKTKATGRKERGGGEGKALKVLKTAAKVKETERRGSSDRVKPRATKESSFFFYAVSIVFFV